MKEAIISIETVIQDGRERVVMDRSDYEDLIDARDHAMALRDVASGATPLTEAEMDAYLAATTPLAYWRKRSGKTQAALAAEAGVSQPFLAQMETGQREGSIGVMARLARILGVKLDDLVEIS